MTVPVTPPEALHTEALAYREHLLATIHRDELVGELMRLTLRLEAQQHLNLELIQERDQAIAALAKCEQLVFLPDRNTA